MVMLSAEQKADGERPQERPGESIRLSIAGHAHEHWTSWSVSSDLLTPADGFQLDVFTQQDVDLPDYLHEGAPCELMLGRDRVLTGILDEYEHDISRRGHQIRLSGRDLAATLVDCSTPFVSLREASLNDVIDQIVKPLGIERVEIRADQAGQRRRVQIEPGQTAWEALQQVAEANGLWPWIEPDGRLVIGGPDYDASPVATLVLRRDGDGNNVERMSVRRSMAERYSHLSVLGQHGQYLGDAWDSSRGALRADVQDSGLTERGIFRPRIVVDSGCETPDRATLRARKLLADSRLEGFEIRATVRGHRTSGGLPWAPGQRVRVESEPHGLDDIYFLMSRSLRLSRQGGAVTELSLREDKAWVLDATAPRRAGKASQQINNRALYRQLHEEDLKERAAQGGSQ